MGLAERRTARLIILVSVVAYPVLTSANLTIVRLVVQEVHEYRLSPEPVTSNVYFAGIQVVGWKPNVDISSIRWAPL
jgi:hypothetical protein